MELCHIRAHIYKELQYLCLALRSDPIPEGLKRPGHYVLLIKTAELSLGRLFMINYELIESIPRKKDRHVSPAMCLLYLNHLQCLVPIAIQLKQCSGPENPVYTPKDYEYDWRQKKR